jgi:hypothetical protein
MVDNQEETKDPHGIRNENEDDRIQIDEVAGSRVDGTNANTNNATLRTERNPIHEPTSSRVMTSDLSKYIKSKDDIYDILTIEGQLHLPPFDECTMEFMKDVLSGKKLALRNDDVNMVRVPRYKEFNAVALTARALADPVVNKYVPDPVGPKAKPVSRRFLFNVSIKFTIKACLGHQHCATRLLQGRDSQGHQNAQREGSYITKSLHLD